MIEGLSAEEHPLVLVHVLVKNKEQVLPLYLECLDKWTYPKSRIILFIRTNGNTDRSQEILEKWIDKNWFEYRKVIYDPIEVPEPVEKFRVHEWNNQRLKVIRRLRDEGLYQARRHDVDYYFSHDVDNFIIPETLSSLVALQLPVVSPFLRYAYDPTEQAENKWANPWYSTFAYKVNAYGDVMEEDGYYFIWNQVQPGVHQVELVHATYLVHRDVIDVISYQNPLSEWDYINFCANLRARGIPQFLDNRKIWGCMTLAENEPACRLFMEGLND